MLLACCSVNNVATCLYFRLFSSIPEMLHSERHSHLRGTLDHGKTNPATKIGLMWNMFCVEFRTVFSWQVLLAKAVSFVTCILQAFLKVPFSCFSS